MIATNQIMYPDNQPDPPKRKAVTIKEISGTCIETIPIGTEFLITHVLSPDLDYSFCEGLDINSIWNEEYKFI
jgi:hypothetical protein